MSVQDLINQFENIEQWQKLQKVIEMLKQDNEKAEGPDVSDDVYIDVVRKMLGSHVFEPIISDDRILEELDNPNSRIAIRLRSAILSNVIKEEMFRMEIEQMVIENIHGMKEAKAKRYLREDLEEFEHDLRIALENAIRTRDVRRETRKQFLDGVKFVAQLQEQQKEAMTEYLNAKVDLDVLCRDEDRINLKISVSAEKINRLYNELVDIVDTKFSEKFENPKNKKQYEENVSAFHKKAKTFIDLVAKMEKGEYVSRVEMMKAYQEMNDYFKIHTQTMNAELSSLQTQWESGDKADKQLEGKIELFKNEIKEDGERYFKVEKQLAHKVDKFINHGHARKELKEKREEKEKFCSEHKDKYVKVLEKLAEARAEPQVDNLIELDKLIRTEMLTKQESLRSLEAQHKELQRQIQETSLGKDQGGDHNPSHTNQ